MEAREKAKELVEKYLDSSLQIEYDEGDSSGTVSISFDVGKECALIVVEEILLECYSDRDDFWYQVKKEIEKL